ncbi:MAG TPA: gliding motility-associated C-terminal domain-containing protein [Bacteroidales bacterium]|nr:gliding motility-associated C-terminal domain-containing protein [Bacteroidales bacterium]HPT02219.1 gliding motility-associated C-terminal domain-containing protein [Bacteroidales bacterium]
MKKIQLYLLAALTVLFSSGETAAQENAQGRNPQAIVLGITPVNAGIARLDWVIQGMPSAGVFYVQRQYNTNWANIGTIDYDPANPVTTFSDTVSTPFCDSSLINYRVAFIDDATVSLTISNVVSGNFLDINTPRNPSLDTVSIYYDPSGFYACPIIGWVKSPQHDIAGYIIYRWNEVTQTFDSIQTAGPGSTTFTDLSINSLETCLNPHSYAIAAIDSCQNKSYGTFMFAPHTISLQVMNDIDPCEKNVTLQWNGYDNMPDGLKGYQVFMETKDENQVIVQNFTLINEPGPSDTSYTDTRAFADGYSYTYFVRAVSNNGVSSSSSCRQIKTYHGPVLPDTLYIEHATVVDDDYVNIKYYYSPENTIRKLVLERRIVPNGIFTVIDSLEMPAGGFLPEVWEFNDTTAEVHYLSYQYRLLIQDTACVQAVDTSVNEARSILFLAWALDDNSNQLVWNPYETWYGGVARYELFRSIDGVDDPANPIASLISDTLYVDNVTGISPTATICYRIEAVEGTGNPVTSGERSVSNQACVIRDPSFFMPNAFRPSGILNRTFRPVASFVETANFSMKIYNRWGQMIFETDNIFNGWDGNIGSVPAPAGVYAWLITYRSLLGKSYTKRGLVTLIR